MPPGRATGYWVVVRAGEWGWVACRRVPGQPYQPTIFPTRDGADEAASRLAAVLWPASEAGQEFYFNTQHFASSDFPKRGR